MCSMNTVVSSLLTVDKEFYSNKSSEIHYLWRENDIWLNSNNNKLKTEKVEF